MEKAVCYIRVSTEEQARGGVSLAAQEERLAAYCKMTGAGDSEGNPGGRGFGRQAPGHQAGRRETVTIGGP